MWEFCLLHTCSMFIIKLHIWKHCVGTPAKPKLNLFKSHGTHNWLLVGDIILLNVPYNSLSNTLALWINELYHKLLDMSTQCLSPYILHNVVVFKCMKWAKCFGLYALFIKIHFEKAYDRVGWSSILNMLKSVFWAISFKVHVETLFLDASTYLYVNHAKLD